MLLSEKGWDARCMGVSVLPIASTAASSRVSLSYTPDCMAASLAYSTEEQTSSEPAEPLSPACVSVIRLKPSSVRATALSPAHASAPG